jgi:hypothetical protein
MSTEIKEEENVLNYFENYDLWTKFHYFAFKYRKIYPNLFFHYFNYTGRITNNFNKSDINQILKTIRKYYDKCDGMWGFISIQLQHKNGITLYKYVSESEFNNSLISLPCLQDAKPYSEELKVNIYI